MPKRTGGNGSILLWVILWLALALRLFRLGEQSLWYDEGVTWYLTTFRLDDLVRWTAADIQPPLYYLLLWLSTRLFGQTEWALRFPSVLFGVLSVPLVWQLGRRLFGQLNPGARLTAGLSAGLVALAPLMIYYSQEARMYTLLVFQAGLAGILLLRLGGERAGWSTVLGYIIVMALALYTHYFAAFLLLAHALYLLVLLVNRPAKRKRLLVQGSVMLVGVGLLFTPWLPVILARLGDDPSYWPGVLKLPEVIQDVFISFAVGGKREMILEADGLPLAAGFGVLLLLCLIVLLRRPVTRRPTLFLLLWLVVPITLILLLSYRTPKFNPRYTMLAWPPFVLLLAGGLAVLCERRRTLPSAFSGLALLFILFSWGFSLHNWFFVDQFSRDTFRAVAQFVRERSFLNEPVLLCSGHFFPVWLYYAGPDNWTPLPKMETLDVNRVIGFEIAPQLEAAIQGRPGVWLVTWQDEVVDPNGVIPLLLDVVGTRTKDELLIGDFFGVGLQYWHLPETVDLPDGPPITLPVQANFGNLVRLHGAWQSEAIPQEIVLFWEALQPLAADYTVSLRLVDAAGVAWSAGTRVARPAAYLYPTERWPAGKIVPGRQILPWLPGAPPGVYWLEVGWLAPDGHGIDVLDANGNPQRRTVLVGPLQLTKPVGGLAAPSGDSRRDFGALQLLAAHFEPETVEAGSKVLLETIWRRTAIAGAPVGLIAWQDEAGDRYLLDPPISITPVGGSDTVFRMRHRLSTPYQAAGPITLLAQVGQADPTPVAGLTLSPTERNFELPVALDVRVDADFDNLATLLGATIERSTLAPGESGQLTLYWQANAQTPTDYTVFVHPLGPDGLPVLNFDHTPPRPTSNWLEGEIVVDPVTITIPPDFPPGHYPLEVGLYDTSDPALPRLPLLGQADPIEHPTGADYLILTEIEVRAP